MPTEAWNRPEALTVQGQERHKIPREGIEWRVEGPGPCYTAASRGNLYCPMEKADI